MGIFASRNIKKDEELTFNYNVDRYGFVPSRNVGTFSSDQMHDSHDAQPCYCGEPKCVGYIGGKTQTDIAAMDDLYLEGMLNYISFTTVIYMGDICCSPWHQRRCRKIRAERQQEKERQEA
jgi:hypothetical protein